MSAPETRRLEWGGNVPSASPAAWGARAIYHLDPIEVKVGKDGKRLKRPRAGVDARIELLWDRKCAHGDPDKLALLFRWLDSTGIPELKRRCEKEYLVTDSADVIEFGGAEFGGYQLRATPNESCGYLYIVAYSLIFVQLKTEGK